MVSEGGPSDPNLIQDLENYQRWTRRGVNRRVSEPFLEEKQTDGVKNTEKRTGD
jgi:hypothetical protein